jgi:hypothetical protein
LFLIFGTALAIEEYQAIWKTKIYILLKLAEEGLK